MWWFQQNLMDATFAISSLHQRIISCSLNFRELKFLHNIFLSIYIHHGTSHSFLFLRQEKNRTRNLLCDSLN